MKRLGLFLVVLAGFLLLDLQCPISFLFHVSCPACGMCRAWLAALKLDFAGAFAYHPLFLLGPVVIGLVVVYDDWNFKGKDWLCAGLGILFFVSHILRSI